MPNRRHYEAPAFTPEGRLFFRAVAAGEMHEWCEFCARRKRAGCPVMIDPVAAWSGPEEWCWAYTEDAAKVRAEEKDALAYASAKCAAAGGVA